VSRRPCIITQAAVARAIRAAKQAGAHGVEVRPDGCIFVRLVPLSTEADVEAPAPLEGTPEIVL